jgi:tRNA modification GTPase
VFPGTTRDTLSELISIDGIPVLLTDTAGVRESIDPIEQLGIERTNHSISDADIVVLVIDSSVSVSGSDVDILTSLADRHFIVAFNKSDLNWACSLKEEELLPNDVARVHVSARTGSGIDVLRREIIGTVSQNEFRDVGFLITDARHFDLLLRAVIEIEKSESTLVSGSSEEIVLVGMYNGLRFLNELTGETTTEDLLSEIFSTFCIGK